MRKPISVFLLIAVLALLLSACGGAETKPADNTQAQTQNQQQTTAKTEQETKPVKHTEAKPSVDCSAFAGDWLDFATGEVVLTIREDGTALLNGREYEIDSIEGEHDIYSGTHLHVRMGQKRQDPISIDYYSNAYETETKLRSNTFLTGFDYSGDFIWFMINYTDYILVPAANNWEWINTEITMENWQDYFTLGSQYQDVYNAFDEWIGVEQYGHLYLKEDYIVCEPFELGFGLNYHYYRAEVDLDFDQKTVTELSREPIDLQESSEGTVRFDIGRQLSCQNFRGGACTEQDPDGGYHLDIVEDEITRVHGTVKLIKTN